MTLPPRISCPALPGARVDLFPFWVARVAGGDRFRREGKGGGGGA